MHVAVRILLYLIAFVSANELGCSNRPVEHSSSRLSFNPGLSYNTLTSDASSHRPVSYNAPTGVSNYETEYYSFTAPEDVFDDQATVEKIAESVKKKVRVIFIKNPENTVYEDAVLSLFQRAANRKTAIYVLNKQHDISDLAVKLNAIQNDYNRKPEVHFVKYRAPEDAYNAQRAIQSHYDSLGGSAQRYEDSRAPVLNFASPIQKTFYGPFQTPNSEYLPAIFPRSNV